MTNPFAQFNKPSSAPTGEDRPSAGNPFLQFQGGLTIDEEEQKTIGEINSVRVATPETFGLATIPKDVGKGIARELLSFPQDVGATLVEAGETAEGFSGKSAFDTAKTSFMNRFLARELAARDEDSNFLTRAYNRSIFSMLPIVLGVEKDVALNAAFDSEGAKAVTNAGYNMIRENRESLERMNLVPKGETSVAYDIGQGFASVLRSVGLLALTKNPNVAGAHMAWLTNSRDYLEARQAGKEPEEAAGIAAASAAGQGAIEVIGGRYFLSAAKSSPFIKRILTRILGQAGEEVAQSGVEVSVKNVTGVRDQSLQEALMEMAYAGFIGAVAGAPVATVTSSIERFGESLGVPRDLAKETALKIGENYDQLTDAATTLLDKETSGLGREQATTEASIKAVNDVIQQKEAETQQAAEEVNIAEQAVKDEIVQEVQNVSAAVEDAVRGVEQTVREVAPNVDANALKLINDKLSLLEEKAALFRENRQSAPTKKGSRTTEDIGSDLDIVTASIDEVDSALREAGVDPTSLDGLKALRRNIQKSRGQAERVIRRADRTPPQVVGTDPEEAARRARDYELVAEGTTESRVRKTGQKVKDVAAGIVDIGSDVFTPISTRLGKINANLKTAVRKYAFNTGLHLTEDKTRIKPFVDGLTNMKQEDYRVLDLALKNRDDAKVNELLSKYDLQEGFTNVRAVLDDLFDQAQEVGLDMHYVDDYFPRQVRRDKVSEYLAVLRGRDDWSDIQAALDEADPERTFTNEEKADFINNYLRGFTSKRILLAASGFTKTREVDYVTPEFNDYYESSPQALIRYVDGMRYGIEARRLFGKDKADGSIGDYVAKLVEQGQIDSKNEEDVKKMLKALVDQQGTRGVVTFAKNASYIYVMGSPISAITQIGDLAFSLANNGYYNTFKSLGKAVFRRSNITKEDIGIEHVLQEFEGETSSAKAVRTVFKLVGLEYMDNVGKETNMNAALLRLQKQAKKNDPEFQSYMQEIFGDEADAAAKDLVDGIASENVKFLLFSELSDVQPVSLAEMPVGYLKAGNGRVLYMLKTYTLKLLDIHRRKWIDEIASGDPKRMAKGVQNLTRLSAALMLMGMTSDALKDLVMDRDFEVEDLVLDNIIKMAGISKYQIYKSKTEGIMNAFWQWLVVPPIGAPLNDLSRDVSQIGLGDKKLKDADVLQRIPLGGKLYYWWWGGGKTKERKKKKSNVSTL